MVELTNEQLIKLIDENRFFRDDKRVYSQICTFTDGTEGTVIRTDDSTSKFNIQFPIIDRSFYENGIIYIILKRATSICLRIEQFKHENIMNNLPVIPDSIISEIIEAERDIIFKEIRW